MFLISRLIGKDYKILFKAIEVTKRFGNILFIGLKVIEIDRGTKDEAI